MSSELEEGCETELVKLMRKVPGCEEAVDDDVREWMELDGSSEPLGKDEIVAAVKGRGKEEEEDDSESNMESSQQEERISHRGGVKSFEEALHYLQQQGSSAMDVLFLR